MDLPKLLSLISHEIRGPLGVVRGYLRMLDQQSNLSPEHVRQAVAAALRASNRVSELLDETSQLAHFERGGVTLDLQPVGLESLLAAAAQGMPHSENPPLDVRVTAGDEQVLVDEGRLRAALNALMLAVWRAQADPVTLDVNAAAGAMEGRQGVRIDILAGGSDLTTAHETELDIKRGGLGLGLPLALAIISAHHGRVSELTEGAWLIAIVVWLPTV